MFRLLRVPAGMDKTGKLRTTNVWNVDWTDEELMFLIFIANQSNAGPEATKETLQYFVPSYLCEVFRNLLGGGNLNELAKSMIERVQDRMTKLAETS